MNILHKIFFPGFGYPGAIIWHIILGGIIAALLGVVTFGYNGHGNLWLPILGAAVAIVVGYVVRLTSRP
ncbi:hypothetical protein [Rufibacter soli]